jgi:hypothetical protein
MQPRASAKSEDAEMQLKQTSINPAVLGAQSQAGPSPSRPGASTIASGVQGGGWESVSSSPPQQR